jgi:hypothetical protein
MLMVLSFKVSPLVFTMPVLRGSYCIIVILAPFINDSKKDPWFNYSQLVARQFLQESSFSTLLELESLSFSTYRSLVVF